MEKLCKIRDLYLQIADFELEFQKKFGLSLNEGMALCSLKEDEKLSSGRLSELLRLSASNTSKILKSLENKNLIIRELGKSDKRSIFFSLTNEGKKILQEIQCTPLEIPKNLEEVIG